MRVSKIANTGTLLAKLELIPPIIRNKLLLNQNVTRNSNIKTRGHLSFPPLSAGFDESVLATAIGALAKSPNQEQIVTDSEEKEWRLKAEIKESIFAVFLELAGIKIDVSHLILLAEKKALRIQYYDSEVKALNLPKVVVAHWRKIVGRRPLKISELKDLASEFSATVPAVSRAIANQLAGHEISFEHLVPSSLKYYERLIGSHAGQLNIIEYANQVLVDHFRDLLAWSPVDGLHQALLVCSHSEAVRAIPARAFSGEGLLAILAWAEDKDPISIGAVLELMLLSPSVKNSAAIKVSKMMRKLCDRDREKESKEFELLSRVFKFVYGQLSATRVMSGKPPYWWRLAALSHAALIVRHMLSRQGDWLALATELSNSRGLNFYTQAIVDLRLEPRWLPEFASGAVLRNEIMGRVLLTAMQNRDSVTGLGLGKKIFGKSHRSLEGRLSKNLVVMPGPLEGNLDTALKFEPAQLDEMRKRLDEPDPTISTFMPIANLGFLTSFPTDFPTRIGEAIRRARHWLRDTGKKKHLQGCLTAISSLAAASRSHELADEIFTLVRNYRRFFDKDLSVDEALKIGIIACASRKELREWCDSVQILIRDLSFGQLSREEARGLHRIVLELCDIVPELWPYCGASIAAIESVIGSRSV